MKPLNKCGLVRSALLGLLIVTATPAVAHTVRSRPATGTVEALDLGSRTVTFSSSTGKAPTELALTGQTQFVRDWHFADPGELKPGTRAVVYYRTPFLGRPFVTKVVWIKGG